MIDARFRTFISRISGPVVELLRRTGISPNGVTVLGFFISSSASVAIFWNRPVLALALWWGGRTLDALDGGLARRTNRTSEFGAFLDITLDMLAYASVVLGLSLRFTEFGFEWLLVLFLYIGCVTGALSLGTLQEKLHHSGRDNRGLRLATGLAEGGETGIAYSLFFLFPEYLWLFLPIWIGILTVTILARFIFGYHLSRTHS